MGYNLNNITGFFKNDTAIIKYASKYFLVGIYAVSLAKVLFQGTSYSFLRPYLLFPIPKIKLIFSAFFVDFLNNYNIIVNFFIVGFWLKNIFVTKQFSFAIFWLFIVYLFHFASHTVLSYSKIIVNNYKSAEIKKIFIPNFVAALAIFPSILFSEFQLPKQVVFYTMTVSGILCFTSLIIIYGVLKDFLYEDTLSMEENIRFQGKLNYFIRDPLILLQIKLLLRNRLLRGFILQEMIAFIFVVYELQKIGFEKLEKLQFFYPILLLIFVSVLTGYFLIVPYAMNVFGIESSYMPFLLTKNVDIGNYIKSKINFIVVLSLFFSFFSAFLAIWLFPYLIISLICFSVYFNGVAVYFLIIQSIKNYYSVYPQITLFQNVYNVKNKKTYMIIAMVFPIILFMIVNLFYAGRGGYYLFSVIILIMGIIGIFFRKYFVKSLIRLFIKNKYDFLV